MPTPPSFLERFTRTFAPQPLHQLAKQTRWHLRQGKIDAFEFLTSLVFGQLSPKRQTLCSQSQSLSQAVTRQAIDQRFTPAAVAFLRASFAHVLAHTLGWCPDLPQAQLLRTHFKALYLLDSTCFDVPASLQELFPACGGAGSTANVKILLRYELITGALEPLQILAGKRSDQGQALAAAELLSEGQLQLQDKGFHDAKAWRAAHQRGAYLVCPLLHSLTLWVSPPGGSQDVALDLAASLAASTQNRMEWPRLNLGLGQHRLEALRLVAFRLCAQSASRRRQGLRESMRKQGRTPSAKALQLAGWLLLVTNAPES